MRNPVCVIICIINSASSCSKLLEDAHEGNIVNNTSIALFILSQLVLYSIRFLGQLGKGSQTSYRL